jgi:hypothetical protein
MQSLAIWQSGDYIKHLHGLTNLDVSAQLKLEIV